MCSTQPGCTAPRPSECNTRFCLECADAVGVSCDRGRRGVRFEALDGAQERGPLLSERLQPARVHCTMSSPAASLWCWWDWHCRHHHQQQQQQSMISMITMTMAMVLVIVTCILAHNVATTHP
eukprot:3206335-Rhodomonas_salina.1